MPNDSVCIRCKKPVKEGIKCVRCGNISHKCCLVILKKEFIGKDSVLCCNDSENELENGENQSPGGLQASSELDSIKISYLEKIISNKDEIIENQKIAIKALTEQLELLKQLKTNNSSGPPNISSSTGIVNKPSSSTTHADKTIKKAYVANALHHIESERICQSVIDLNKDSDPRPKMLTNFAKKSRSLLTGSLQNSANCTIKASNRTKTTALNIVHYHATNMDVATSENELLTYLVQFAPNIKVKKLNARFPEEYSSFKLSLPVEETQSILNAEIWPHGADLKGDFLLKIPGPTRGYGLSQDEEDYNEQFGSAEKEQDEELSNSVLERSRSASQSPTVETPSRANYVDSQNIVIDGEPNSSLSSAASASPARPSRSQLAQSVGCFVVSAAIVALLARREAPATMM
ncbi:unnamed protein product [Psylliodes chrysocephalus]|uniref:Phorbol-ester/DAG-type domain-containing protein n=1 Tax=Psylliodes chrysocephalus TaxID=3402493 RepID=A0A9P0CWA9_9CUCU|nr:unnamed protein product [Psylliodes chrysocephala]